MTIDIRNLQNQRQVAGQRPGAEPADARPGDVGKSDEAGKPGEVGKAGEAGKDSAGADSVRLSAEARRLQSLQESAHAASEVDTSKVEQVRREIAEGRYHVDARKLASSILSLERELLG